MVDKGTLPLDQAWLFLAVVGALAQVAAFLAVGRGDGARPRPGLSRGEKLVMLIVLFPFACFLGARGFSLVMLDRWVPLSMVSTPRAAWGGSMAILLLPSVVVFLKRTIPGVRTWILVAAYVGAFGGIVALGRAQRADDLAAIEKGKGELTAVVDRLKAAAAARLPGGEKGFAYDLDRLSHDLVAALDRDLVEKGFREALERLSTGTRDLEKAQGTRLNQLVEQDQKRKDEAQQQANRWAYGDWYWWGYNWATANDLARINAGRQKKSKERSCASISTGDPSTNVRSLLGPPDATISAEDIRGPGAERWTWSDINCQVWFVGGRVEFVE